MKRGKFYDGRKVRWKKMDPEARALFAQKGGLARAAKMTPEAMKAHSKRMLDIRYEALREIKRTLNPESSSESPSL